MTDVNGGTGVQFSLLGPLQVTIDGVALKLGGTKQRAVLAALTLEANRVVPFEQLIDAVWGEDPPIRVTSTLQVYISNLRRVLEPGRPHRTPPQRLTTERTGYLLRIEPAELDVTVFRELTAEGKAALAADEPAHAADVLVRALTLWRGPALADLAAQPFFVAAAVNLEEQRLAALEARIDADLAVGRHSEVVAELEQIVSRFPLRERFHGQRMVALYRSGRQAEALAAFQEARQVLSEELGLDPSPELRQIQISILKHGDSVRAVARPADSPVVPSNVPCAVPELPAALRQNHAFGFRGRTVELDVLDGAWKASAAGSRRIVLIAGEPGMGKTRLASEAAQRMHDAGALVLFGRCEEGLDVPYRPLVEVLTQLLDVCDPAVLASHIAAHGGELARLLPELTRRHPEVPPPANVEAGTQRYLLFEAVAGLLTSMAATQPVVLCVDDLHWADKPSLLLLRHIARKPESMALLLVCTYRSSGLRPTDPVRELLGDLRREEGVDRIRLSGLGEDAVLAMLTEATGQDTDAKNVAVAHTLRRETEGSPFFVEEMLYHLQSTGALQSLVEVSTDATGLGELILPESIREVIMRRLHRLPPEVLQTLSVASVVGHSFRLDPLSRILDRSEDDVLAAVETAIDAGIVVEDGFRAGQFLFAHRLIRNTLYDDLTAARRARLHRRIGEALEARHATLTDEHHITELAHHWFEATQLADIDKAVWYTRRAGDQALRFLAYEEAARHYERALSVQNPGNEDYTEQRGQLLIALADARRRAGDPDYRAPLDEAARLARSSGDAVALGTVALTRARPGGWTPAAGTVDATLVELCEEVLAAPLEDTMRARVLGQLAVELYWTSEHQRRVQLGHDAVALARTTGDPDTLARALGAATIASWGPDTLEDRLAAAVELHALARELQAPELRLTAAYIGMAAQLEAGDPAGVRLELQEARRLTQELRVPFFAWNAGLMDVTMALLRGEGGVEQLALEMLKLGEGSGVGEEVTAAFSAQMFGLRWNEGRLDEVIETVERHVATMATVPAWRAALALAQVEAGDPSAAATTLAPLTATRFDLVRDSQWMACMAIAADACILLEDEASAALLWHHLAPYADRMVVVADGVLCWGAVARLLGALGVVLGRWEEAAHHLDRAMELHRSFEARPFIVRTLRTQAELLTRRPDPNRRRAERLRSEAGAMAAELGMAAECARLGQ